jgi:cyclic pyranopterin phosphate synthase
MSSGVRSIKALLDQLSCEKLLAADSHALHVNCNTKADAVAWFGRPLLDPFGRRLHYLRFSLTEVCNLSCTYCLPDGSPEWYRHKARLSLENVQTVLSGFRRLGFRKVRFTGGEPTIHPGCLESVAHAARIGFEKIALSTNGLLINDLTRWKRAGLTHINVSLDSVDPDHFEKMTRSRDVQRVLDTIDAALEAGIKTSINAVLMRSVNLSSVDRLMDWALARPLTLRFIELMPTHLNKNFSDSERVHGYELMPLLEAWGFGAATLQSSGPDLRGPATDHVSPTHKGRIGLINPLSQNFCSRCNRLRVTAKGKLKLCLFGNEDLPLDLTSAETVEESVRAQIWQKPERHHLEDKQMGNVSTFRTIGG